MENTEMNNAAAALYGALAKAQGEFKPIEKNREVSIDIKDKQTGVKKGSYQFRYADLEEILSKTRPALSANGLALVQTVEHGQQGPLLVCRLVHAQGGMMASGVNMPGVCDMTDPKAFGSTITYLRRYLVTAMLGVAADDDLDEDGQEMNQPAQRAAGKPAVTQPERKAAPAKTEAPAHPATPASGDMTTCSQGEINWMAKKLEAKGMTKAQAYEAAGITFDEGAAMTKAEFAAIKAVL